MVPRAGYSERWRDERLPGWRQGRLAGRMSEVLRRPVLGGFLRLHLLLSVLQLLDPLHHRLHVRLSRLHDRQRLQLVVAHRSDQERKGVGQARQRTDGAGPPQPAGWEDGSSRPHGLLVPNSDDRHCHQHPGKIRPWDFTRSSAAAGELQDLSSCDHPDCVHRTILCAHMARADGSSRAVPAERRRASLAERLRAILLQQHGDNAVKHVDAANSGNSPDPQVLLELLRLPVQLKFSRPPVWNSGRTERFRSLVIPVLSVPRRSLPRHLQVLERLHHQPELTDLQAPVCCGQHELQLPASFGVGHYQHAGSEGDGFRQLR
mmetsp:Transcript_28238/g.63918  ORF Transcript_28238/g.63918 Transcript_28238/m.63918 type:complete len:319 (+) Transcript_28238:2950-3906(+)